MRDFAVDHDAASLLATCWQCCTLSWSQQQLFCLHELYTQHCMIVWKSFHLPADANGWVVAVNSWFDMKFDARWAHFRMVESLAAAAGLVELPPQPADSDDDDSADADSDGSNSA